MHKRLALFISVLICLHASTALGIWNYERPNANTAALMGCWSDDTVSYAVGMWGAAFRHKDGTWTDITDTTLAGANLLTVHGTPSGAVYAAGNRLGPPRFDSNGDGQINTDDGQSLYGVIFRYTGSAWEELNTGYGPESPFFASSFTAIWADDDHVVYFAGGKQLSSNTEPPSGVLLSYDSASFAPLAGSSSNLPTINGIWGNRTHAYLACSSDATFELNRSSNKLSVMKSAGYAVDYRGIQGDEDGTLYAVAEASSTDGYIFRYHATNGWELMGIDREEPPPLNCIAKRGDLLVASGSYGKTYSLDREQNIWKEMLVGTQSHINCLSVAGNDLLGATEGGELYRMTEETPNTAYILADPPTGIGTWMDGTLTHEVTLYDFALGDIWKREWNFNNGNHHDPMPSYGALYSYTPAGVSTALYITGEGGEESNRELRISDCNGCTPHVDVTNGTVSISIQSGHTTQSAIKELLENSPAVSDVYVRHDDSAWVVSGKEFDSVFLTGGRDDEDIYINEATSGDSYYLTTHKFKDKGTWEPSLTVYRENVAFLDGMIKIYGNRQVESGPTIVVENAENGPKSPSAEGTLGGTIGGTIAICAIPGERGNIDIILIDDPSAASVTATFSTKTNTLYVIIQNGITTIQQIINQLAEENRIQSASLSSENDPLPDPSTPWDMATMISEVSLEGGANFVHCDYNAPDDKVTVTIDNGITTTTDIAQELSALHKTPGDEDSDNIFAGSKEVTPSKAWNVEDRTNEVTLPGVTTETSTATVRVFDQNALNFTHTPDEAKLKADVTLADASDPNLDIIKWEWHVFREVPEGYDTKAAVESDTGTAEVTISDLGTYDIGLKATLKDGSTLTMVKEEALDIKGKHAGDNSLGGANGCFIGAASTK